MASTRSGLVLPRKLFLMPLDLVDEPGILWLAREARFGFARANPLIPPERSGVHQQCGTAPMSPFTPRSPCAVTMVSVALEHD